VVCGDFFQLPPVTRGGEPTFAFEGQMWGDCVERTFNLTRVFRQKDQRAAFLADFPSYPMGLICNSYRFRRHVERDEIWTSIPAVDCKVQGTLKNYHIY
jgi:hypothetical protein